MFLYHSSNEWRGILRPARSMNIVLGVVLGVAIFWISRACFSPGGAQVSLGLFCLSPVVLSNSAIATTDLAAALWFMLAVHRWWTLFQRVTAGNLLLCGAFTGGLFVTKFSSFALLPVITLLALVRLVMADPILVRTIVSPSRPIVGRTARLAVMASTMCAAGVVAVLTVWACYLPQLTFFADRNAVPVPWEQLPQTGNWAKIAVRLNALHLLPEPYLLDLWVFGTSTGGRRAFLWGEYSIRGWWYFFPVAFWFKSPLPFLVAIVLGLAGIFRRWREVGWRVAPFVGLIAVYGAIAMTTKLNLGIRHLLPIYPALFVLAGGIWLLPWRSIIRTGAIVVMLAWSAVELWPVRSNLLAYFNVFGGGTERGHRILVDSSFEWGQDLPAVERWVAAHKAQQRGRPVYFSYFGNADLSRYGIDAVLLPQFFELRQARPYSLKPGTYLISATMLQSLYGPLFGPWRASYEAVYQALRPEMSELVRRTSWTPEQLARFTVFDALRFGRLCAQLRERSPDARVTAGVLVFEVTESELDRALSQPIPAAAFVYEVPGTEHLPQSSVEFLK
jgi:hypothetical protein